MDSTANRLWRGDDLAAAALLERFGLFCQLEARNLMLCFKLRHLGGGGSVHG